MELFSCSMGRFALFLGWREFLLCERRFDFVEAARECIEITDSGVIQFGGRSSMQAPILCPGNIGGIGRNPDGYGGAYPAPRPCDIHKLVHRHAIGSTASFEL
jgi:hypothetical protein